jgi:acetyl-CoA C-acetyltransferase
MGISNELCSEKYGVTREDQDRYAAESYRRALAAIAEGRFKDEIMPVEIPQRKGAPLSSIPDECPSETSYEALAKMRPAFQKTGTARPATPRSSATGPPPWWSWPGKAEALGCPSWPTIGAQASYGIEMKYVLVAPIWAIPKCLAKQGIAADVDLFEINEAFSGSTLAVLRN